MPDGLSTGLEGAKVPNANADANTQRRSELIELMVYFPHDDLRRVFAGEDVPMHTPNVAWEDIFPRKDWELAASITDEEIAAARRVAAARFADVYPAGI